MLLRSSPHLVEATTNRIRHQGRVGSLRPGKLILMRFGLGGSSIQQFELNVMGKCAAAVGENPLFRMTSSHSR